MMNNGGNYFSMALYYDLPVYWSVDAKPAVVQRHQRCT